MTDPKPHCKPPPPAVLRMIFDHQRWLNSNGRFGKRLDKDGLNFDNCDLEGVDLSGATLVFACFRGGTVRGARFIGACLGRAQFLSCDVTDASFVRADLTEALFATNHEGACFDEAKLDNVAWSEEERAQRHLADRPRPLKPAPPMRPR